VVHVVVVGGGAPLATAALARCIADAGDGQVVVWDERDTEGWWRQRPGTFEVRALPLADRAGERFGPGARDATTRALLTAHLVRHRRSDVVLVGRRALLAAPWFRRHRGRVVHVPTLDDLHPLAADEIPAVAAGGPTSIAAIAAAADRSDHLEDLADHRWSWLPGWQPEEEPPRPAGQPLVVALGPVSRMGGIDVLGRALAHQHESLRSAGARVRWLTDRGLELPAEDLADLHRAGVDDLVEVRPADPTTLAASLDRAAAVVLCGRDPDAHRDDPVLRAAHRRGARLIATDRHRCPAGIADRWTAVPLGDARSLGAAIAGAVEIAGRDGLTPPGPFGVDGLFARRLAR
jgi:hypothetical protein